MRCRRLTPLLSLLLLSGTVFAQAQSPYSAQLTKLAADDQADRQYKGMPTPAQIKQMSQNDPIRKAQVLEILSKARGLTGADFDNAGLVLQHGSDPEDFVLAHFLSICANVRGKFENLPAVSEDRYLEHVNRLQRFGAQFGFKDGKPFLEPVDETPPTAVTDNLRFKYVIPTLAQSKEHLMDTGQFLEKTFADVIKRRGPKPRWEPGIPGIRRITVAGVLKLYQADELDSDLQMRQAAHALLRSHDPNTLILAHELSALAFMEDHRGGSLAYRCWTRFCRAIHRPQDSRALRKYRAIREVFRF